jgi:A/G-specific adenine glycosylase
MEFSNTLIKWYLQNKRDLPWRNTQDPYFVWLSEIILQQTRVAQGLPYYQAFVAAFPTVHDLARAAEQDVLKLWQGLGYYSRARNLHQAAQYISTELNGEFPNNYQDLLQIKGIGTYTAAAVASFCYNEAVPVVDGNVFRVLARYLGVPTDIALASAKKEFYALAAELMPQHEPAIFNQALMEFGALQCVPKSPNCVACVFQNSCSALAQNQVASLPHKSKKNKVTERHLNYLVFQDDVQHSIIQKRMGKGIWQNLYEFPCIESTHTLAIDELIAVLPSSAWAEHSIQKVSEINPVAITHLLSHQRLAIKFWKIQVNGLLVDGLNYEKIRAHPFPIVLYNFIANDWHEL